MSRPRLEWLIVVLLARTAAAQPAGEGRAEPPAPAPAPSPAPSPAPAPTPAPAATALTDAERTLLLQKTLEVDALAQYYDKSKPLKIALTDVVKDKPALSMFGSPVVYVDSATDTRAFRFTTVGLEADKSAKVELRYPRQGLHGHVIFTHDAQGGWSVQSRSIAEH